MFSQSAIKSMFPVVGAPSNSKPFFEAQFKTLNYHPGFLDLFQGTERSCETGFA